MKQVFTGLWRTSWLRREIRAELRTQIDELRRLNYWPILVEFLEAYQQVNSKDWQKARQTLIKLQAPLDSVP